MSFEAASSELDGALGQISDKSLDEGLKKTRASLARSIQFAQASRGAMEQHAKGDRAAREGDAAGVERARNGMRRAGQVRRLQRRS